MTWGRGVSKMAKKSDVFYGRPLCKYFLPKASCTRNYSNLQIHLQYLITLTLFKSFMQQNLKYSLLLSCSFDWICLGIDASSAKKEGKVIWKTYDFISRAGPKSAKYCLSEYASENKYLYILKTLWECRIENGLWNGRGHIYFGMISMFEQGALFQKEMHLLCT